LEVFHNPYAHHPVPFELVPDATHWFDQGGELVCSAVYEHSVLWSQTIIQNESDPIPRPDEIMRKTNDQA